MDEVWFERRSGRNTPRDDNDARSPWMRDYARVIHSASFRRLQAKTQILNLGESDFYRTRLTHSLEVAQVGKGILFHLKKAYQNKPEIKKVLPETELIETICLTHDIGHPPFGHGGEVALNYCMRLFGGFEGNGQTLRIISKIDSFTDDFGLDLTRRAMLGVLKYPVLHSAVVNELRYSGGDNQKPVNANQWKPPKAIFDCDNEILEWVLSPLNIKDKSRFVESKPVARKAKDKFEPHSKGVYKSLDCSIMELADDISYGVHDLEDAISLKLIDRKSWNEYFDDSESKEKTAYLKDEFRRISEDLFSESASERKKIIGSLVHRFITAITINSDDEFSENLLKYNAKMQTDEQGFLELLKGLVVKKVIKRTNVQYLEFRGQRIIGKLFDIISSDPERFLRYKDAEIYKMLESDEERKRKICDFIAGMTDDYAVKLYKKLFIPGEGSVFDRL